MEKKIKQGVEFGASESDKKSDKKDDDQSKLDKVVNLIADEYGVDEEDQTDQYGETLSEAPSNIGKDRTRMKVSSEEKEKLTSEAAYLIQEKGYSLTQVAESLSVNYATIRKWLKAKGVRATNRLDINEEQKKELILKACKLRKEEGISLDRIARMLAIPESTLNGWMRSENVLKFTGLDKNKLLPSSYNDTVNSNRKNRLLLEAFRLEREGINWTQIAQMINTPKNTVLTWKSRRDTQAANYDEKKDRDAHFIAYYLEIKELLTVYNYAVLKRIERTGEILKEISISNRSVKEVSQDFGINSSTFWHSFTSLKALEANYRKKYKTHGNYKGLLLVEAVLDAYSNKPIIDCSIENGSPVQVQNNVNQYDENKDMIMTEMPKKNDDEKIKDRQELSESENSPTITLRNMNIVIKVNGEVIMSLKNSDNTVVEAYSVE